MTRMKTLPPPSTVRRLLLALPAALLLASCAMPDAPASTSLDAAIAAPYRGQKAQARDVYRHPKQTLEFFGVEPTQSVLEIAPGGGWYTDILGPYLKDRGNLYEAEYVGVAGSLPEAEARSNTAFEQKLASNPSIYGKVPFGTLQSGQFVGLPAGLQVDRVLTFRNIHNWIEDGQIDANLRAFYSVLKPGGVLGVEEHRAKPGTPLQQMIDTGYLTEAYVIQHVQAAGFKLVASSAINDNPRDTKDYPNGVWSLPPTYRGGDVDRARFAAIGESDRMTLRFVKP
jgi:predicted methyltransferase